MASYVTCEKLVPILVLLVIAVPGDCFSQSPLESAANREYELVDRIEQEQSRNGPHSEELIGPLTALALLYEEEGDRALATTAIERARQVVRANEGLYSLEQTPFVWQLIANEEAIGNAEAAWNLEQELLKLARRHPEDRRSAPIFREIADRRLDMLERYLGGEFPPELFLGCYYDRRGTLSRNCNAGSRSAAAGAILAEAVRHYRSAIDVFRRNERYASDELRELELAILRNCHSYRKYRSRTQGACRVGASLHRLLSYDVRSSTPQPARVRGLVRIADWRLLSSLNRSALDTYEQVYEQLEQSPVAQAFIDQIFSPETPVVLPDYMPNPLASQETPESTGYIDSAFEITKYGKSRGIEILETTTNATDAAQDRLIDAIKASRFRPRLTDGRFETSRVTVRYYVTE